uniref:Spermidine/putrescine transport system permease protein n=1 Tax=Candidatus Kentrum sp. FW TaxID=2126338 RepID=A0A450TSF5_9GAMM|nr:MAG: spermidine/putrescine transport system permease protein [Candidatus Kentron sp. FW]
MGLPWKSRNPLPYSENVRGYGLLSPTLILLTLAMAAPIVVLAGLSLWTQTDAGYDTTPTLDNYIAFFDRRIYPLVLLRSLKVSALVALATVSMAYPAAYFVAFRVTRNKILWLILITLPFWTSYLLRVFSWKLILGYNGLINSGLLWLGVIERPLDFLVYNVFAVVITLAHAMAAFAIFPIYLSLSKIDRSLIEAAHDLGEGPVMTFFRVTLPLSLPGVVAAALLVFIPTVGDYVTPKLVGGTTGIMIGNLIQSAFGRGDNWPLGAAISMVSMIAVTLTACVFVLGITRFKARIK